MFLIKEKKSPFYQIVYIKDGKRKKYSTKTNLKHEAKKILTQFKRQQLFSNPSPQEDPQSEIKNPKLDEFREEYIKYIKLSKSKSYVSSIDLSFKKFSEFAGNPELRSISTRLMDQFLSEVYSRAKYACNLYYKTLKAAFSKAVIWEYMDENPVKKLKPPKLIHKYPAFLNKDELNLILDKVTNPKLKDIYLIAFYTGMRLGEILNMRWDWVVLNERVITIRNNNGFTAKSKRERKIPMNEIVYDILNRKISETQSFGYVFTKIQSAKLNNDYVSKMFKRAVRAAKINDDIHMHSLRHSFGSNLVQRGASLYVVKELLGHEDIKTTQVYSHLIQSNLVDAIKLL